ncbi:MAG: uroporphyrinogen decarboxylase family protein, partial [bacterium]
MKSADKPLSPFQTRVSSLESRLLRAARAKPVDRTPVWFMRQAGRYLPEYRKLREKHSIHEICQNAGLMVEATLQPIRRFPLDAAILFSDISILLKAMGVPLRLEEGKGPVFLEPLRDEATVRAFVKNSVKPDVPQVTKAIQTLVRKLPPGVPLIGFAGSPFTLSAYMIEGGYVRD